MLNRVKIDIEIKSSTKVKPLHPLPLLPFLIGEKERLMRGTALFLIDCIEKIGILSLYISGQLVNRRNYRHRQTTD